MAGSLSIFAARELLDHLLGAGTGGTSYTQPANIFVGLSTTAINEDGTGITEPSGNGYARVSANAKMGAASNADPAVVSNSAAITFPAATGSWGTVTHFFIADASSGGNVLVHGTLNANKTVANGDTVQFAIGALQISLD